MNKTKIAVILTLLMAFVLVGSALAQIVPVTYEDTAGTANPEGPEGGPVNSLIRNGDFNSWSSDSAWIAEQGVECDGNQEGNSPDYWCVWTEVKTGWEAAHMGPADLALGSEEEKGESYGLSFFLRHQGNGTGSYHAGAWQLLDNVTEEGYYFISIGENMWYNDDRGTGPYHSVAYYTISDSNDPWESDDWRELDPYTYQCKNSWEICAYVGRDETVHVSPGQYLHLIVSHSYPVFNASTVFLMDDVFMVPADDDAETNPNLEDPHGYYTWYWDFAEIESVDDLPASLTDLLSTKCHFDDLYCIGFANVNAWDEDAPR